MSSSAVQGRVTKKTLCEQRTSYHLGPRPFYSTGQEHSFWGDGLVVKAVLSQVLIENTHTGILQDHAMM